MFIAISLSEWTYPRDERLQEMATHTGLHGQRWAVCNQYEEIKLSGNAVGQRTFEREYLGLERLFLAGLDKMVKTDFTKNEPEIHAWLADFSHVRVEAG